MKNQLMAALLFSSLALTARAQTASLPICNYRTSTGIVAANKTSDLLQFVRNTSEYISSANGLFEHFTYNRLFRTELTKENFISCVTIVKVGVRDFGNGNTYGDYFIQVAYTKPGQKIPQYILTALYKSGSVQSMEGPSGKPWYILSAENVAAFFGSGLSTLKFADTKLTATDGFNPVDVVKQMGFADNTKYAGLVYDDQGITYTPLYLKNDDQYFLVTWGTLTDLVTKTPAQRAMVIKVSSLDKKIATAFIADIKLDLLTPLDALRGQADPQLTAGVEIDNPSIAKKVLELSVFK